MRTTIGITKFAHQLLSDVKHWLEVNTALDDAPRKYTTSDVIEYLVSLHSEECVLRTSPERKRAIAEAYGIQFDDESTQERATMIESPLYTTEQAAEYLRISRSTFLRRVKSGDIAPGLKSGGKPGGKSGAIHWHIDDLNAYINQLRQASA